MGVPYVISGSRGTPNRSHGPIMNSSSNSRRYNKLICYIVLRAQILEILYSCPKTKSFGPCPTIAYETQYITPTASTSFLSSVRLNVLYFSGCEIIPILQYWEAVLWAKGPTHAPPRGGPPPTLAEVKWVKYKHDPHDVW